MKVVLIKDVKDMGRAHSTVEVSDGHALNYLIPRKLAVPATQSAVKQADARLRQVSSRKELDLKLVADRLVALAEERIVIKKKANEQGHLYDAVDAKEIAEATKVPEEVIKLEKPIKELGSFNIPISMGEQFGQLTVIVEAE